MFTGCELRHVLTVWWVKICYSVLAGALRPIVFTFCARLCSFLWLISMDGATLCFSLLVDSSYTSSVHESDI